MEAKIEVEGPGTLSSSGRDAQKLRRPFNSALRDGRRQMIHKMYRPPSPDELKQLLIAAFAMGVVVASAYFILFVVK